MIQESATVISSEINARRLTVDNPAPLEMAILELHSPGKIGTEITLGGPAEFGAGGRCEIVYHNVKNVFACRAESIGGSAVGGFTLHDRAVIRANDSKAGSNLHLELTGHFDVRTTFRADWQPNPIAPTVVANHWDTRTTDLFLTGVPTPSEDPVKLEVYARDIGDVVFTDTPCRGTMQDLTITGINTIAELADEHANNLSGCQDTLYFRNVTIGENSTLEVGSQVIDHYGALTVIGKVTQYGVELSPQEIAAVIIEATPTCFGDLNDDGDVDDADRLLMEAAFGSPVHCP